MPEPGQTVSVSFNLPGDTAAVESAATVTWQNLDEPGGAAGLPPGCGLRFTGLIPADHHRIGALVHDYQNALHPRVSVPKPYTGFIRIPYVQPCALRGEDDVHEGLLCNLSLVGAYVTVDPIPLAGEQLRLAFKACGHPVEIPSEVAWVNAEEPHSAAGLPPGCGLRFGDMSDDARVHVAAVVHGYELLPRTGLERT